METSIHVTGFDHIVLRVADAERSMDFYVGLLGLEPINVDEWRQGKAHFPSVRVHAETIIDLVERDREGINLDHFCIAIAPIDLDALAATGRFEVDRGPVERWGARGLGQSLYVRDPDQNIVELHYYS